MQFEIRPLFNIVSLLSSGLISNSFGTFESSQQDGNSHLRAAALFANQGANPEPPNVKHDTNNFNNNNDHDDMIHTI